MRLKCFFCAWLFLGVAGLATASAGGVALQYHCAGGAELADNTNLTTLHSILALPSTAKFEKMVLEKLGGIVAQSRPFQTRLAESLIDPLLADLFTTESLGSFGGSGSNSLDFILAVRLEAKRSRLWQDNAGKILGTAGEKYSAEKFEGLRWASNSFWLAPAGDWLVMGSGDVLLPLETEYLGEIGREGRPVPPLKTNWLEAEGDLAQLAGRLPEGARLLKPARIKLSVAVKDGYLEINGHAVYAEAMGWESKAWQIPTNLVQGPLISFSAGQDVAAFLNLSADFSRIENNPLTNQFCAWAQGAMVFQSYMEWPAPNASNALQTLSSQAPAAFNSDLKRIDRGEVVWLAKRGRLVLSKRGTVSPYVEVAPAKEGQYLLLSLFPLTPGGKPAPAELWEQIKGRTDLVYYDWEATGPRLQQWRLLSGMLLNLPRAESDEAIETMGIKEKWLNDIGAPKGNTVTEITRVAPNELSLLRTSPLGFTGIETILLSDWMSGLHVGRTNAAETPASKSPMPHVP